MWLLCKWIINETEIEILHKNQNNNYKRGNNTNNIKIYRDTKQRKQNIKKKKENISSQIYVGFYSLLWCFLILASLCLYNNKLDTHDAFTIYLRKKKEIIIFFTNAFKLIII